MLLIVGGLLSACGNDIAHSPDAPPPGTPMVVVTAPTLNQAFYMTRPASVVWKPTDDGASVLCDVIAIDGTTTIPIAMGVRATSGVVVTTPWLLTSVAVSDTYVVQVSCADDSSPPLLGVGMSAVFSVVGAPQAVAYATQIQPIWTAKCIGMACHDNTMPQERLNLTSSGSRAALVGVPSQQCPSTQLVNPGDPDQSYLIFKLQGSGPCLMGSRMPKGGSITGAQIQLVRDWIVNGAPNN